MKKYLIFLGGSLISSVVFLALMLLIAYSWRLALWVLGIFLFVVDLRKSVGVYQQARAPKSEAEFVSEVFGLCVLLGFSLLVGYGLEWLFNWPAEYFEITLLKGFIFVVFSALYFLFADEEYNLWSGAKRILCGILLYLGCGAGVYFALRAGLLMIL